jgi:hypothetical protein
MGFLRRSVQTAHEELCEHWEQVHAPRVAHYAAPLRYAVTFFEAGSPFDGVASLWMRDEDHFRTAFSPEQVAETNKDGFTGLIDPAAAVSLMTTEHVMIPGEEGGAKFVFVGKRRAGAARGEYQRLWLEEHAPAARTQLLGRVRRYAVSTTNGPETAPYDGCAELWMPGAAEARQLAEVARTAARDAWGELNDPGGCLYLAGREVLYVDGQP